MNQYGSSLLKSFKNYLPLDLAAAAAAEATLRLRVSLVTQLVKNPPAMQETWFWSLSWEDSLERGKASSSILACRISWTAQSMGLQRVWHDWATFTSFQLYCACVHAISLQSCLTPCDPMECSPIGSSTHGILQLNKLEWVATPSSRGLSPPRDSTPVS